MADAHDIQAPMEPSTRGKIVAGADHDDPLYVDTRRSLMAAQNDAEGHDTDHSPPVDGSASTGSDHAVPSYVAA
ncbi:hypothetical protein GCM10027053_47840 [Intrasporangium mesophilum]